MASGAACAQLACMLVLGLLASSTAQQPRGPPLILFGGRAAGNNMSGFLFPDVRDGQTVHFVSEVNSIACAMGEKVMVGTDNSVTDAEPTVDHVAVQEFDGETRAVIPIETMITDDTVATGMVLVGGVFTHGIALWDRFGVQLVGQNPLDPPCVLSMAYKDPHGPLPHNEVVVGGCFQRAGPVILNSIGLLTFANGHMPTQEQVTWQPIGDGLMAAGREGTAEVYAVSTTSTYVFAGGRFSHTLRPDANNNLQPLHNVARYEWERDQWFDIGGGVDGIVRAMAANVHSPYSAVYIGGAFCSRTVSTICNVAFWDDVVGWKALGKGVRGEVFSLLMLGPAVWVGGRFISPDTMKSNLGVWLEPEAGWYPGVIPGGGHPDAIRAISPCPCKEGHVDAWGNCATGPSGAPPPGQDKWHKGNNARQKYIPQYRRANDEEDDEDDEDDGTSMPHWQGNPASAGTFLNSAVVLFAVVAFFGPIGVIWYRRRRRDLSLSGYEEIRVGGDGWMDSSGPLDGVPLVSYSTHQAAPPGSATPYQSE